MFFLLLLLLSLTSPLAAQVTEPGGAEPEEPEIVLPEVILQIEDLSTELIEAGLPAEEELLPPPLEREVPLPEAEALAIREPLQPPGGPASEGAAASGGVDASSLAAQIVLGAGSMNYNFSSITLYRVGEEPRFRLNFLHELLDGFGSHPPGTGYNFRQVSLEGGVKFPLAGLEVSAEGLIQDGERGLQKKGSANARVFRQAWADLDLLYPAGDRLDLGAGMEGVLFTQLLTGSGLQSQRELVLRPRLQVKGRWERLWLGAGARYGYRSLPESGDRILHRLGLSAEFGVEIQDSLTLAGDGGWFWSSRLGSLFPFQVSLSGTPFASLSFRAAGGYRLEELDRYRLLNGFPLVEFPDLLEDDHGWFADLSTSLGIFSNLSFQAAGSLAWSSARPDPELDAGPDPLSGLFAFRQSRGVLLATTVGLKWSFLDVMALSTALEAAFLDLPEYISSPALRAELEAAEPAGRWGGAASVVVSLEPDPPLPLLGLSGFLNVNENIALVLEAQDLLYPLIRGPRYSWSPFEEPGLRGIFKIQITL